MKNRDYKDITKKSVDIKNSNQKKRKLEEVLLEFSRITNDNTASILPRSEYEEAESYYNYIYKNINNSDFNITDVTILASNPNLNRIIGNNYETNAKFGLFLSALINKNIKNEVEVQLNIQIPIHYLFYKLENAKAHVNIAGDYLGRESKNSVISTNQAGDTAGLEMQGCELYVKKAGRYLGNSAKNSKIYTDEAEYVAGPYIEGCELHVKKASDYLGYEAKNSKIYADEAGYQSGKFIEKCELYINKAGDELGFGAKKSTIFAEKAGNNAGMYMRNSKLSIYKLKGKLNSSCFKENNEIYLGEESYKKHPLKYRLKGVKILKEKTLERY